MEELIILSLIVIFVLSFKVFWSQYFKTSSNFNSTYVARVDISEISKYWLQNTLKLKTNITIRLSMVNSFTPDLFSNDSRSRFQNPGTLLTSQRSHLEMSGLLKSKENNILYRMDIFQFKIKPENRLQNLSSKFSY